MNHLAARPTRHSRPTLPALALLALLAAVACNAEPSAPAATVGQAAAPTGQAAPAGAVTHAFTQAAGQVSFVASKVSLKHDGGFKAFSGTITLPGGQPEGGAVRAEIDMASVFTDSERLTGHLKAPDFFDVARFPRATFESTRVTAGGPGGATHTVTGNLDLHGVKKSLTFPATISVAGDTVSVRAEFSINRKDFGIVYPGMPDDLIQDEVKLKLELAIPRVPRG